MARSKTTYTVEVEGDDYAASVLLGELDEVLGVPIEASGQDGESSGLVQREGRELKVSVKWRETYFTNMREVTQRGLEPGEHHGYTVGTGR